MNEENKWITLIRENNDDLAYSKILANYANMIQSIITGFDLTYGSYCVNRDDLFQEGNIGLYEACKSYREEFKTKFSTYAYTIIKRRIQRFYYANIKTYKEEICSIDNEELIDHCSYMVYENNDIYRAEIDKRDRLDKVLNTMSYEDREIVKMRINNYSYKEISSKLNINPKRIDNRLARIKERIAKNNLVA